MRSPLRSATGRSRARWRRAVLAAAACLAVASPAAGQVAQAYLTYSAADTGPLQNWTVGVMPGASVPLHLWIQGGGSASGGAGPCQPGATGNEICGVNVVIESNGFYSFDDFTPVTNFDSSASAVPMLASVTSEKLTLNALDFGTPGLGNRYLGVIVVRADGMPTMEDAMTVRGGVMRANMTMEDIQPRDVAVPESALAPGLLAGCAALSAAARRRTKSGSRVVGAAEIG